MCPCIHSYGPVNPEHQRSGLQMLQNKRNKRLLEHKRINSNNEYLLGEKAVCLCVHMSTRISILILQTHAYLQITYRVHPCALTQAG
jgi:hypothetical protein